MNRHFSLMGSLMIAIVVVAGFVGLVVGGGSLRAQDAGPPYGYGRGQGMGMGMMRNAAPLPVTEEEAQAPVDDMRLLVPMPPETRKILRDQMKQFLATLAQIQGLLAEEKLEEAAELAETNMGRTERGKHGGKGPGRYMPIAMRSLAWGMHDSASEFAEIASKGDLTASYKALQTVQYSCVACHFSYRTR